MEDIQYPIGKLSFKEDYTPEEIAILIKEIEEYPRKYREILNQIPGEKLGNTYRPGAWTIAQLVHHVADMQVLHYFRMKRALTEPDYKEATMVNIDGWASLPDAENKHIDDSLVLFEGVHARFAEMARNLNPEQFAVTYYHPVRKIYINQKQALAMAVWHIKHHYAHIQIASKN